MTEGETPANNVEWLCFGAFVLMVSVSLPGSRDSLTRKPLVDPGRLDLDLVREHLTRLV
jgi:hypothetical protein